MTGYLNEDEAGDCLRVFTHYTSQTPNLAIGARIIVELVEWTNSCSDGWAYWMKPRRAAAKLIDVLDDRRREYLKGHDILDISDDELKTLIIAIKSFLTKQGVDWNAELPWAAIFPVHPTAVAQI